MTSSIAPVPLLIRFQNSALNRLKLRKSLADLYQKRQFCDVEFETVDGEHVSAHCVVIAGLQNKLSDYINKCAEEKQSNNQTLRISVGTDFQSVDDLKQYIYEIYGCQNFNDEDTNENTVMANDKEDTDKHQLQKAMDSKNPSDGESIALETTFLSSIYECLKNGKFTDTSIVVNDTTVKVHRAVLVAASPYFKTMFRYKEKNSVVDLSNVMNSGIVLTEIMKFIYSGIVLITDETVENILGGASFLLLSDLIGLCSQFLLQNLSLHNCLWTWRLAQIYNLEDIVTFCTALTGAHFHDYIIQLDELPTIDSDFLKMLMEKDYHKFVPVLDMLTFLIKWTLMNYVQRKDIGIQLMGSLSFDKMTLGLAVDRVKKEKYAEDALNQLECEIQKLCVGGETKDDDIPNVSLPCIPHPWVICAREMTSAAFAVFCPVKKTWYVIARTHMTPLVYVEPFLFMINKNKTLALHDVSTGSTRDILSIQKLFNCKPRQMNAIVSKGRVFFIIWRSGADEESIVSDHVPIMYKLYVYDFDFKTEMLNLLSECEPVECFISLVKCTIETMLGPNGNIIVVVRMQSTLLCVYEVHTSTGKCTKHQCKSPMTMIKLYITESTTPRPFILGIHELWGVKPFVIDSKKVLDPSHALIMHASSNAEWKIEEKKDEVEIVEVQPDKFCAIGEKNDDNYFVIYGNMFLLSHRGPYLMRFYYFHTDQKKWVEIPAPPMKNVSDMRAITANAYVSKSINTSVSSTLLELHCRPFNKWIIKGFQGSKELVTEQSLQAEIISSI